MFSSSLFYSFKIDFKIQSAKYRSNPVPYTIDATTKSILKIVGSVLNLNPNQLHTPKIIICIIKMLI